MGTLVDVGKGKVTPEEFMEIINSKDRSNAGITAPPQGLVLREVKY
jgi:tRNA pseudouridine38-40 synthase